MGAPLFAVDSSRGAVTGVYGSMRKLKRQGFPSDSHVREKPRADFNAVPVATKACDGGSKSFVDAD
jgi:hypothetical protein